VLPTPQYRRAEVRRQPNPGFLAQFTAEHEGSSRDGPMASTRSGGAAALRRRGMLSKRRERRAERQRPAAAQQTFADARLRHLGQVSERGLEIRLGVALVGQLAGEVIGIGLHVEVPVAAQIEQDYPGLAGFPGL
jgi:hypothetical protein